MWICPYNCLTLVLVGSANLAGIVASKHSLRHLRDYIKSRERDKTERWKVWRSQHGAAATAAINDVHALAERIATTLTRAEKCGADGEVEQSLVLMKEVDSMNAQKAGLDTELKTLVPHANLQQQNLRVCEICSSCLGMPGRRQRSAALQPNPCERNNGPLQGHHACINKSHTQQYRRNGCVDKIF